MPPMVDELVIHCTMPLISDVEPSVTTSDGTRKIDDEQRVEQPDQHADAQHDHQDEAGSAGGARH